MSDEEKRAGESGVATAEATEPSELTADEQTTLSADEHTTEPNAPEPPNREDRPAPSGQWQMPKPKFQQTSGYLPQGYLNDIKKDAAPKSFDGSEDTTQEQAPFVPAPPTQETAQAAVLDVEPQPDLSEQLIPEEPATPIGSGEVPVKKGLGFGTIVFGLVGIIVLLIAFLVTVYFVFLAKSPSGNNF